MSVDGRGRRESDGLADVTDGRRVAVLRRVALDEVEDLLLALRELQVDHLAPPFRVSLFAEPNMCSQSSEAFGRLQADGRVSRAHL